MILGKVMMAQSANKRGSVEYQISKKTLMLEIESKIIH